tara:strand:- start:115 stop:756 length:642 start_codon:yes stop_codon:yes gene_type:complete
MKLNLKANAKMLLKSKAVLYIVFFIAVTNLFSYLMLENYQAVSLFVFVGFLTNYFSKNMIVVMSMAILLTSLFVGSKFTFKIIEGFKEGNVNNTNNNNDNNDNNKVKCENGKCNEALKPLKPAKFNEDEDDDTDLDYSGTLEAAYDNLDKLLDSGALNKMSNETQILAEKQNKLLNNIDKIGPMIDSAQKMMSKLDNTKINDLMNKMESFIQK